MAVYVCKSAYSVLYTSFTELEREYENKMC